MVDHVKPTLRECKPDHLILHVGTNDLNSESTSSQIARSIIDLATSLISDNCYVSVSGIVPRNDGLNNKASEVNNKLINMCKTRNIPFIDHVAIDPTNHLNASKLHLNRAGTSILAKKFLNHICKFID